MPSLEGDARALAAEPSARGWTRCLANLFQLHWRVWYRVERVTRAVSLARGNMTVAAQRVRQDRAVSKNHHPSLAPVRGVAIFLAAADFAALPVPAPHPKSCRQVIACILKARLVCLEIENYGLHNFKHMSHMVGRQVLAHLEIGIAQTMVLAHLLIGIAPYMGLPRAAQSC